MNDENFNNYMDYTIDGGQNTNKVLHHSIAYGDITYYYKVRLVFLIPYTIGVRQKLMKTVRGFRISALATKVTVLSTTVIGFGLSGSFNYLTINASAGSSSPLPENFLRRAR
jgi:hypothetical protein